MNYYHNSTIRIKPGAKRMKRTQIKRVPGTARIERSPMNKKREPPALIRWRRECRIRDNYTCQFPKCGHQSKRIDVHHIAKRSQRPDLKFDITNGVCLCRLHHDWTDRNRAEAIRLGLLSDETYEKARKDLKEAA